MAIRILILFFCSVSVFAQNPPVINFITVDSISQEVLIDWSSSANNVEGYVVYKQDQTGLWAPLDTVFGESNTTYLTTGSLAAFQIERYSISSFDAVGNSSVRSIEHNTMFLENEVQSCSSFCNLSWNSYTSFFGLNGFILRVVASDPNTGAVIDEYDVNLSVDDSTYSVPFDYQTQYFFRIDAKNVFDDYTFSNSVSFLSNNLIVPDYSYINKVSVLSDRQVEVSVLTNSPDVEYFEIYRSYEEFEDKDKVGEAYNNGDSYVYVDDLVYPALSDYFYSAIAIDKCGQSYVLPNYLGSVDTANVSNLLITEIPSDPDEIHIERADYDGFLNLETDVQLWKEVNGNKEFIKDLNNFSNSVVGIKNDEGQVCVYLLHTELGLNELSRKDTVYSNRVCRSIAPRILIPDVFTPNNDGLNDLFLVYLDRQTVRSYKLDIYDIFGRLLFTSKDQDIQWDGTFKGKEVQSGHFLYSLSIVFSDGIKYDDFGGLFLLR